MAPARRVSQVEESSTLNRPQRVEVITANSWEARPISKAQSRKLRKLRRKL